MRTTVRAASWPQSPTLPREFRNGSSPSACGASCLQFSTSWDSHTPHIIGLGAAFSPLKRPTQLLKSNKRAACKSLHLISSSLDSVQPSQALVSRPSQAKKAALEDGQKDSWSMTHGPHLQIHLTKDGPCSLQHGAFFLVLPSTHTTASHTQAGQIPVCTP